MTAQTGSTEVGPIRFSRGGGDAVARPLLQYASCHVTDGCGGGGVTS